MKDPVSADGLTIASVGIVAYVLANVFHEGVGHGGACLLVGARPLELTTVYLDCSADHRLVTAGGTLMNVVAGALFFALGRAATTTNPIWKYFCWLSMTINLLTAAGYFGFSGIGGIGDWAEFIKGLGPQWLWRIGMTLFGVVAYLLAVKFSLLEMRPLIGSDEAGRQARAATLGKIPYFTGGILACIAGLFNPQGMILVAISAAASTFGGTSGLVWMDNWLRGRRIPYGPEAQPLPIQRSLSWIVLACILAVVFVAVLGPGVRFPKPGS